MTKLKEFVMILANGSINLQQKNNQHPHKIQSIGLDVDKSRLICGLLFSCWDIATHQNSAAYNREGLENVKISQS